MEIRRTSLTAYEKAGWLQAIDPAGVYNTGQFVDDVPELRVLYDVMDYRAIVAATTLHDRMNPERRMLLSLTNVMPQVINDRDLHEVTVTPDSVIFLAPEWVLLNISPVIRHAHQQLQKQFGSSDGSLRIDRYIMPQLSRVAGILNARDDALRSVIS